jgi:putative heme-binding domain-containing protein
VADRARSYLDANCSHCHRFGGGGATLIDLRYELTLEKSHAIGTPPLSGNLGLVDARVIAPGDPGRSALLCRMAKVGSGRMPRIGSEEVDKAGVVLMEKWIAELGKQPAPKGSVPPDPAVARARAAEAEAFQVARTANTLTPEASAALDKLLATPAGALTLAAGLHAGAVATPIREAAVERATASANDTVRDLFEPFLPPDKVAHRLGTNVDRAKLLATKGDADRGWQVFFETSGGLCAQCHQVDGKGQEFGPDLSHVAAKYDRAALLENILEPSKTIDPKYATTLLKVAGRDEPLIGLVVERTPAELVVKDVQRQAVRVPAKDVLKETPQPQSAMPEGLLGALTAQQAADLLEFLSQRK